MPSLKEIKGRIASVNSTRKITSAMKMVASSKLHHAQVAIQNMLPYETMLEHILKSFLAAEAEAQTIYDQERPVKRAALVVFSSNSSLCGGFNANTIKMMTQAVDAYAKEIGRDNVEIYPIGRKVYEKAQKLGLKVQGEYSALADKPNVAQCIDIVAYLAIAEYDTHTTALVSLRLTEDTDTGTVFLQCLLQIIVEQRAVNRCFDFLR